MKKVLIGTISALIGGGIANAADLPTKAPPPAAPVYVPYNWTGFYIGGNVGGAWANGSITDDVAGFSFSTSHSGFLGGGQVGFNYQVSNIVLGVEGDFDWTSLNATGNSVFFPGIGAGAFLQGSANTKWISTVAARLGVAYDRWLFYAKGGGGWIGNNATVTDVTTGATFSTSNSNSGWVAGAGIEWAFTPNWSARVEYDYIGLRNFTVNPFFTTDTFTVNRNVQTLTLGLNYKFDWGSPAYPPVAARY
jgi:outer membrane immunogenic protein